MFKNKIEDELFHSMQQKLSSNQLENKHSFTKLAKAVDYLNTAASIFEAAGMHEEAKKVTEVLQDLAKQLSGKTSL